MRALPLLLGASALLRRARPAHALLDERSDGPLIADGFSRVSCVVDASPASVRVSYDDGNMRRPAMEPSECFTFCRDKAGMRFFLIAHGRDCYCAEYYDDQTAGGGDCDLPCEGDSSEMCGGTVKASAFEMHLCGTSGSVADAAAASAVVEAAKANESGLNGMEAYRSFANLSVYWQLPVCSKSAEVCAYSEDWLRDAHEVRDAAVRALEAANASYAAAAAVNASKAAGFNTTEGVVALESAAAAARDEMSAAAVAGANVGMVLDRLKGPLGSAPALEDWEELFVDASSDGASSSDDSGGGYYYDEYYAMFLQEARYYYDDYYYGGEGGGGGAHGGGFSAICALQRLEGKSFVVQDEKVELPPSPPPGYVPPPPPRGYPGGCADACVAAGTTCVGFNYQLVDGAAACQLLTDAGVFSPEDALGQRFPVFEISSAKVQNLGYQELGCYVTAAFLARDGGIRPDILDTVYDGGEGNSTLF